MPEKAIKQSINTHLRQYAEKKGIDMPDVNRAAKKITGKARGEMTLDELEIFHGELESHFPLS